MAKKKRKSGGGGGGGGGQRAVMRYAPAYGGSPVIMSTRESVKRTARRAGRAAVKPMGLLVGGGVYGYLEAEGHLSAVPTLGDLPQSSTIAAAAILFNGVHSRNQYVREGSVAAVVIGGFDLGRYLSQRNKEKASSGEKPAPKK